MAPAGRAAEPRGGSGGSLLGRLAGSLGRTGPLGPKQLLLYHADIWRKGRVERGEIPIWVLKKEFMYEPMSASCLLPKYLF